MSIANQLASATVALWIADLDALCAFDRFLSLGEQNRAGRFLEPVAHRRWIAARGWLRIVLAHCTGIAPGSVDIVQGPLGKPSLAGSKIKFSLSHSGSLALIGISQHASIGVDIEGPGRGPESFLVEWTAREAYLKAIGLGLSSGLDAALPRSGWTIENVSTRLGYVSAFAVDVPNASVNVRVLSLIT